MRRHRPRLPSLSRKSRNLSAFTMGMTANGEINSSPIATPISLTPRRSRLFDIGAGHIASDDRPCKWLSYDL